MKYRITTLVMAVLFIPNIGFAQGIGEWFSQNSTQRKYLLQQIAALQVYIGYAKKGYDIVKDGTGFIGKVRKGELDLHTAYFNSLKTVKPGIKKMDKVEDIFSLQKNMLDLRQKISSYAISSQSFNPEELIALRKMLAEIANEADKDLEQLKNIISDNALEMNDDERIRRIDALFKEMQVKAAAQKKLNAEIRNVAAMRGQGKKDLKNLKSIYGLE